MPAQPTAPSSTSCSRRRASSTAARRARDVQRLLGHRPRAARGARSGPPPEGQRRAAGRAPRRQRQPRGDRRPAQGRARAERRGAAPAPDVARNEDRRRRAAVSRRRAEGAAAGRVAAGKRRGPTRGPWTPSSARSSTSRRRRRRQKSVAGLPVHPGVYEGPARIINGPEDFNRLQQGDVLVTRNTGPAFNVVLPLLGAIVTDRGGQLSHAAIVAREYGIPAVVGTREATTMFADGARVRVNGDTRRGRARGGARGEAFAARRRARRGAVRRQGGVARALAAGGAAGSARYSRSARPTSKRCSTADAEALTQLRVEFTGWRDPVPCDPRRSARTRKARASPASTSRSSTCATRTMSSTPCSRCATSRTPSRRVAYRRTLGMDEAPRVGVVVQRMIEPDCAGVMFTKNPLNGCERARHRGVLGARRIGRRRSRRARQLRARPTRAACCGGRPAKRTSRCAARPEGGTVEEAVADELVAALLPERRDAGRPARPGRAVRVRSSARGWTSSGPSPTARCTCCSAGPMTRNR